MKLCKHCDTEKELTEFYKNKKSKDGHQHYCKDCTKKKFKEWKSKNFDRWSKKHSEWQRNNKDKVRSYFIGTFDKGIKHKIYLCKNSDERFNREYNEDYYITLKWAKDQLNKQNNKCHYCKCELVIFNYNRGCKTQISFDRIENGEKAHTQDNVVVSCLLCNRKKAHINYKQFKNGTYKHKRSDAMKKAQTKYYLKRKKIRIQNQNPNPNQPQH